MPQNQLLLRKIWNNSYISVYLTKIGVNLLLILVLLLSLVAGFTTSVSAIDITLDGLDQHLPSTVEYTSVADEAIEVVIDGLAADTPETTITDQPTDPSNSTAISFTFESDDVDATFECQLDTSGFSACISPEEYTGLSEGEHTFDVKAIVDSIEDPTPASYTWTIDLTAPETAITSQPTDPAFSGDAIFVFESNEIGSTFECQLDSGGFTSCISPVDYSGLIDGAHSFEVRATDEAGNTDASPASYGWTIDTTIPETYIISMPGDPTNSTEATFTFTSTEPGATYECQLDAGGFSACTSPKVYTGLSDGTYNFQVRAIGSEGLDPTPASYTWTVNTSLPSDKVGYWNFDEGTGTMANDSSGYNNHGTINGATWTSGIVNGALSFYGISDYVQVPESSSLSTVTNQVTFATWLYAYTLVKPWESIMQRTNADVTWFDWQLYAKDDWRDGHPSCRIDWNGDGINDDDEYVEGDIVLQTGTWYHIACTYDGIALKLYIDGNLRNTTLKSGGTIPNSGREIWFGANETWGAYFDGILDEIYIYNRALTPAEIMVLADIDTYALDVSKTGTGSGVVSSAPVGIDCGSDCSEDYGYNTVVTLTATPDSGSTFNGWSGAGCSGTGTCVVTMDIAKSVSADFSVNPAYLWYLAEGYTGSGFGTYILIQNPNDSVATVDVTYMLQSGGTLVREHIVPANSRYTIVAQDPAEVGLDEAFSTSLSSDLPIIVERAMYFENGGHATIGVTNPSNIWYLAEGYTGDGFGTFILIQNPNDTAATVDVTYMLQSGGTLNREHIVPANGRYTIVAQDPAEVGQDEAFSTSLSSDLPIIVERAMYFANGGHNTIGVTAPANTWYLAEGYTGDGFGTFILIQNPNDTTATVDVTYMLQSGGTLNREHIVPANGRYTIVAQDLAEVGLDEAFSTSLSSDLPIIVERAMYFANGGHNTIGVTAPANTWYLAEGYTGDGFGTFILIQNPNDSVATVDVTYMLQSGGTLNREHIVPANGRYTIVAQDLAEVGLDEAFSTSLSSDLPIIVERAMYFANGGHNTIGIAGEDDK